MSKISAVAAQRGITRLCHLTPVRNLLQIVQGVGLRSVADLQADERSVFTRQDLARHDGHPDHISCSIQYPNVWYLEQKLKALSRDQVQYPDWVCLLLSTTLLDQPGVKFAPGNAAREGGAQLEEGLGAFLALFDEPVPGPYGMIWRDGKPFNCPTDDQAEVMLPKMVQLLDCSEVAVASKEHGARVFGALDLLGVPYDQFRWIVAPDLFQTGLSAILRSGLLPPEERWDSASA